MDDEQETYKLWRIRKTAFQMCADRGFLVTQYDLDQTFEEFKQQFGSKPSEKQPCRGDLQILVEHAESASSRLFVFFSDDEKLGIKHVKNYSDLMLEQNVFAAIIVVQKDITPSAKQTVIDAERTKMFNLYPGKLAPKFSLELFKENELLVNVTDHYLVPDHIVLTDDEAQELLQRYKIRPTQLPRLHRSDPVARYFGFKPGKLIKILIELVGGGLDVRARCDGAKQLSKKEFVLAKSF